MPHRSSSDASPPRCVTTCQVGERRREEEPRRRRPGGREAERRGDSPPGDVDPRHRRRITRSDQCAHGSSGDAVEVGLEEDAPEVHVEEVLLLDEPATGLDPAAKASLRDLLARLARERLVVVVDHEGLFDDVANQVIDL